MDSDEPTWPQQLADVLLLHDPQAQQRLSAWQAMFPLEARCT